MGFTREVVENGEGDKKPMEGDTITVHCFGCLYNEVTKCPGICFHSTEVRLPFQTIIGCGEVIKGRDKGIMEMNLGEKRILKISSDYAYGHQEFPGTIPRDSALVFEIRLLGINDITIEASPKSGDWMRL